MTAKKHTERRNSFAVKGLLMYALLAIEVYLTLLLEQRRD